MWSSGDEILVRRIIGGRIWFAHSATVVQDDAKSLVLWLANRTPFAAAEGDRFGEWSLAVSPYQSLGVLILSRGERAHAILFDDRAATHGWYVNLETRTRTPRGIDMTTTTSIFGLIRTAGGSGAMRSS